MNKNVASQKVTFLVIDVSTNAPKTGDAANLTAYVSKDDGSVTVLGDTSATELDATNAPGLYSFDLTQGETNADKLLFSGKSSTANVRLIPLLLYTTPANFAAFVTPTGAAVGDSSGVTTLLSRIASALSISSGKVTVGTNDDKTGYGLSAAAVQAIWDALTSALTTVGSIGKLLVDNVNATISSRLASASITLTGGKVTVGTNDDKTGYAIGTGGIAAASFAASAIDAAALAADAVAEIQSGLATSSALSTLQTKANDIEADTQDIQSRLPAALTGAGNMKSDMLAISGDGGAADNLETAADGGAFNLGGGAIVAASVTAPVTVGTVNASPLAAIADAVLDEVVEDTVTLRESQRLSNAAAAGRLAGAATTSIAIRDLANSKDRIAASVDADGNRLNVVVDVS